MADRDSARTTRRVDHIEALLDRLPLVARVQAVTPTTPDTPFAVKHELGAVPNEVSWMAESFVSIRATEADRRSWDTRFITLRCNAGNAVVEFTIRANRS